MLGRFRLLPFGEGSHGDPCKTADHRSPDYGLELSEGWGGHYPSEPRSSSHGRALLCPDSLLQELSLPLLRPDLPNSRLSSREDAHLLRQSGQGREAEAYLGE